MTLARQNISGVVQCSVGNGFLKHIICMGQIPWLRTEEQNKTLEMRKTSANYMKSLGLKERKYGFITGVHPAVLPSWVGTLFGSVLIQPVFAFLIFNRSNVRTHRTLNITYCLLSEHPCEVCQELRWTLTSDTWHGQPWDHGLPIDKMWEPIKTHLCSLWHPYSLLHET